MSQETISALIGIVPQLLLILIVAVVLLALRRPLFDKILPRVSRVSLIGLQVELQPAEIRRGLETQRVGERTILPSDAVIGTVAERAARSGDVIRGRLVVWIDDHPEWTRTERLVMQGFGLFVEPVRTTDEARDVMTKGIGGRSVDLVISDIHVDNGSSRLADAVQIGADSSVPVIFYVADARGGVPPGAFGLTTRPDELWHLVIDALERAPSRKASGESEEPP